MHCQEVLRDAVNLTDREQRHIELNGPAVAPGLDGGKHHLYSANEMCTNKFIFNSLFTRNNIRWDDFCIFRNTYVLPLMNHNVQATADTIAGAFMLKMTKNLDYVTPRKYA